MVAGWFSAEGEPRAAGRRPLCPPRARAATAGDRDDGELAADRRRIAGFVNLPGPRRLSTGAVNINGSSSPRPVARGPAPYPARSLNRGPRRRAARLPCGPAALAQMVDGGDRGPSGGEIGSAAGIGSRPGESNAERRVNAQAVFRPKDWSNQFRRPPRKTPETGRKTGHFFGGAASPLVNTPAEKSGVWEAVCPASSDSDRQPSKVGPIPVQNRVRLRSLRRHTPQLAARKTKRNLGIFALQALRRAASARAAYGSPTGLSGYQ